VLSRPEALPGPFTTGLKLFLLPGMTFRYKLFTIEEICFKSKSFLSHRRCLILLLGLGGKIWRQNVLNEADKITFSNHYLYLEEEIDVS